MLYRKILLGFLLLFVVCACSIGTSYFFQQNANAQSCVPLPSTTVKIKYWRDRGNGYHLGHWDYCALTQVEGIDKSSGEGVGVNAFSDSPVIQEKTFTPSNKPYWTIWRGHDVDHYEVICICLFEGTCP